MQKQMEVIDEGYQDVVKDIADVVEGISDGINEVITNLALLEEQALEKVVEYGLKSTNQIFSEGLKLDESFQGTIRELGGLLSSDKVKLTHEQRLKMLEVIEGM